MKLFQSTRPMRGATALIHNKGAWLIISIHAPHAGRDVAVRHGGRGCGISIHAPHAGRDRRSLLQGGYYTHFNPRAPCGARQLESKLVGIASNFNPRAPCGARLRTKIKGGQPLYFNPRAPCGARLACMRPRTDHEQISIHAPHAGRDCTRRTYLYWRIYFNPRAPCGARPSMVFPDYR